MLLSTLSLALLSMSAFEPLISRNLADAEQARFAAEAGIEWAFTTLRDTLDWDAFLSGADPARGAVVIANSPIPGSPASQGTYTIRVRNDSLPEDDLVTGVQVDGGGPTHDTNGHLLVTSVGRVGSASRVVQAVLRRIELPPIPAALAFPGPKAMVSASREFEIDGNDRNPDGTEKDWMVLLSKDKNYSGIERTNSVTPVEFLQSVIVLKRVLELNKDMPLTLSDFHIGRQIIFPSQEELQEGNHLVDREVAKLFYEVYNYYPVFEQRFDQGAREMSARLDQLAPRNSTP